MDRLGSLDPTTARRVISDRSGNLPQNAFFFFIPKMKTIILSSPL